MAKYLIIKESFKDYLTKWVPDYWIIPAKLNSKLRFWEIVVVKSGSFKISDYNKLPEYQDYAKIFPQIQELQKSESVEFEVLAKIDGLQAAKAYVLSIIKLRVYM